MTDVRETKQHVDLEALVVGRYQQYLGIPDDVPLTSRLLADLGVDSIAFVAILLDLAELFELDLDSAEVNLSSVETLSDVVSLVKSLRDQVSRSEECAMSVDGLPTGGTT